MITQAIIPLAGLGTRMLPLTKAVPKELWPMGSKSILEIILDECFDIGIKNIILVISSEKETIKELFKFKKKINNKIKNKADIFARVKKLEKYGKKIKFVYQNKPKGLGDAVLTCKNLINKSHFLLLLPDDIIVKKNCSKELLHIHKKQKCSVIALRNVKKKQVSRYGIVGFEKKNRTKISKMVEKPSIKKSPSNSAIIGRYILSKKIFKFLSSQNKGSLGEVQITDAINAMIKVEKVFGCKFKGKYLDCGTIDGYIKSFKYYNSI